MVGLITSRLLKLVGGPLCPDTDTALKASSTCPYHSDGEHKHVMFSLLHKTKGRGQPFAGWWPRILSGLHATKNNFLDVLLHHYVSIKLISLSAKTFKKIIRKNFDLRENMVSRMQVSWNVIKSGFFFALPEALFAQVTLFWFCPSFKKEI